MCKQNNVPVQNGVQVLEEALTSLSGLSGGNRFASEKLGQIIGVRREWFRMRMMWRQRTFMQK